MGNRKNILCFIGMIAAILLQFGLALFRAANTLLFITFNMFSDRRRHRTTAFKPS